MEWYQIIWAVLLGFMIWRMIPVAKDWLENGPRGSAGQWLNAGLLLGGVVLFILFLLSATSK